LVQKLRIFSLIIGSGSGSASQIVKTIGGIRHVYHSPDVARFDHQDVLLWWNPDDLSQVGFSSLDRKQGPFVVTVQETTPIGATPDYEAIRLAQGKINETLAVRRAMFRSVQPWLAKAKLRPTLVDTATQTFGERLGSRVRTAKREASNRNQALTTAKRRVRLSRLNVAISSTNATLAAAAAELERKSRE
jgi:hypothetical protein